MSRIPARFRGATMGTLSTTQMGDVISYAKNIVVHASKGVGLLLAGPAGVGKTWALSALTRHYMSKEINRSIDYEFVTAPEMFDNLGDFGQREDEYRGQLFTTTYARVPWLVINDLGKEYRGGRLEAQVPYLLGRVLRARSERKLLTHVTTNLVGGEGIKKVYGPSIVSLMSEAMKFVVVNGPDLRKTDSDEL